MTQDLSRLFIVLLLGLVPWTLPVAQGQSGAPAFEEGTRAFGRGDYAAALQAFLQARRAGLDAPALRYNLGSTYYRLQRYGDAEREFEALTREPQWAAVAHYNLGLVARQRGRNEEALAQFGHAQRLAHEPKLRALAATALDRFGRAPEPPRSEAYVSAAVGYDSNVTLTPDSTLIGVAGGGDLFVEGLAAGSLRLSGNPTAGWYAQGGAHVREYRDLGRYDQLGLRAGAAYEAASADWRTTTGAYVDVVYVHGGLLQQATTLDLHTRRALGGGRHAAARYRLSGIRGGGEFRYLDGRQQRFSVEAGLPLGATARLRLGYELELNDREDLRQGGEFFSYSPTRHGLLAALALPPSSAWQTELRAEYRASRYNDPHVLGGIQLTRKDDLVGAGARASRRVNGAWRLFTDYSYYRNDSSLASYDYKRHLLTLGAEATF